MSTRLNLKIPDDMMDGIKRHAVDPDDPIMLKAFILRATKTLITNLDGRKNGKDGINRKPS